LKAGDADLFNDPRLAWAMERFGDGLGQRALELGPLEGAHSYMLERAGFGSVIAIEANPRAFLKCLIIKEVVGLPKTQFLCGDFLEYLRQKPQPFHSAIASGVLYHMTAPIELLARLSEATDRLYLWTHYYDQTRVSANKTLAARFSSQEKAEYVDFTYIFHRYRYKGSLRLREFCGGSRPYAHWLGREDILRALRHFGLDEIEIGFDTPDHPEGPAFALVAKRSGRS